jgi:hypothetical protein
MAKVTKCINTECTYNEDDDCTCEEITLDEYGDCEMQNNEEGSD